MEASGLSDFTRVTRTQAIRDAMRVLSPQFDSQWISQGASRMRALAQSSRDKRARMRPAAEIYQLGLHLMLAAESNGIPRRKRPIYYRDGLMIAFMICCPLRISDFCSINVGGHLTRSGEGWLVSLGAKLTKQKRPFECEWPSMLVPQLERYLAHYRPILAHGGGGRGRTTDALWLSERGIPFDEETVPQAIETRTRKAFGLSINPHLFRDIAATEIATFAPRDVSDVAAVLGHSSLDVGYKYYIHAEANEAVLNYQCLILAKMKKLDVEGPDGASTDAGVP
jgi:integrase